MSVLENYQVYRDGERTVARGEISGHELARGPAAESAAIIQTALDTVAKTGGGKVAIGRGTFPLSSPVTLRDETLLMGSGRATILALETENSEGIAVMAQGANGVRVVDLQVNGLHRSNPDSVAGIVLEECGDSVVRGVYARSFGRFGFWLRDSCFLCRVVDCSAGGNQEAGIFLEKMAQGRGGHYVPNLVTGCMVFGGGYGIRTRRAIVANITSCCVYQAAEHSFSIEDESNSVLISGCRSFQSGGNAVYVENSHEFNAAGNVFCWHRGHGIELANVTWAAITGNEVIDSGVRHDPPTHGLWLHDGTRGVQVTGNTVFNWPEQQPMNIGILEDNSCYKNLFTGNTVSYYLNRDVVTRGVETVAGFQQSENMAYAPRQGDDLDAAPYNGDIVPLHKLWHSMGPFHEDEFSFRYKDFTREAIDRFINEE